MFALGVAWWELIVRALLVYLFLILLLRVTGKRVKGQYAGYDADATFTAFERRLAAGEKIPLAEGR